MGPSTTLYTPAAHLPVPQKFLGQFLLRETLYFYNIERLIFNQTSLMGPNTPDYSPAPQA